MTDPTEAAALVITLRAVAMNRTNRVSATRVAVRDQVLHDAARIIEDLLGERT